MAEIVGIDLGTTNSLIGIMDAGFPVLLADANGERMTPSVVYLGDPNQPLVGRSALRMRLVDPAATVYSIKRFIGRRAHEIGADERKVEYALVGTGQEAVRVRVPSGEF